MICLFSVFVRSPFPPYKNYSHDKKAILSDGFGYFSYLPAVFIYKDLSFSFFDTAYKNNYNAEPTPWARTFIVETESGIINKYWIGVSILLLPFFLIAHWLSMLLGYNADGYSALYQYSVFCAAIFYLYLGCRFIYKFLRENLSVSKLICSIALFIIVFSTNLFYYTIYEPSMSHVYSFFCVSVFFFFTARYFKTQSYYSLLATVLFFVFLVLVRPVNAISISFIPFLAADKQSLLTGLKYIFGLGKKIIPPLIIISLMFLQSIVWYKQCHNWFIWSYPSERFYFSDPHFIDILFSYKKGFFIYMPACFLALLGLVFFFRNNKFQFYAISLSLLFVVYVLSSWYAWDYSACFGNRAFVDFYFIFAVLIALSLNIFFNKILFWLLAGIYSLLVFFNHIQLYQYRHQIYHSIDMDKEGYWKVFLHTEKGYENILYDWSNYDDLERLEKLNKTPFFSAATDFESAAEYWTSSNIEKQKFSLSGKHVAIVNTKITNGDGFILPEERIVKKKNIIVESTLSAYLLNESSSAYIVHQIINNGQILTTKLLKISTRNVITKNWEKISYLSEITELNEGDELFVYVLNAGNSSLYYDNFKITLSSY